MAENRDDIKGGDDGNPSKHPGGHDLEASDIPGGPDAPEGFDDVPADASDEDVPATMGTSDDFPFCESQRSGMPIGKVTAGNGLNETKGLEHDLPEGRMTRPWESDDVVAEDEFPHRLIRVADVTKGSEVTDGWLGQRLVTEVFERMMAQDVLDEGGHPTGDCPMAVLDMTGIERFDPRLGRQIALSSERYGGVAARPDAIVAANVHGCPEQVLKGLGDSGIPIVARIDPKVVERFLWRMEMAASGGTHQTCLRLTRSGAWDAPALGIGIEAISSTGWTDWETERDEIALYGMGETPAMTELGRKIARLIEVLHAKAGIIAWSRGGYR